MNRPLPYLPAISILFLALITTPVQAQRGWGGSGLGLYGFGPRLGENIALALELEEELGLTRDQIQALRDLDSRIQQDVAPILGEIDGLRGEILDGTASGRQGLLEMERLFLEFETAAEPFRAEVAAILTPDQHRQLQAAMFDTRPGLGRGLARGSPGFSPVAYAPLGPRPGLGFGRARAPGSGRGMTTGYGAGLRGGRGLGRAGRGFGRGYGRGAGRWGGGYYRR